MSRYVLKDDALAGKGGRPTGMAPLRPSASVFFWAGSGRSTA